MHSSGTSATFRATSRLGSLSLMSSRPSMVKRKYSERPCLMTCLRLLRRRPHSSEPISPASLGIDSSTSDAEHRRFVADSSADLSHGDALRPAAAFSPDRRSSPPG